MAERLTKEMFVSRANEVHSNKYDYSKVVYHNTTTKVIITCPTHGDFEQRPAGHLIGQRCPDCAGSKRLTLDEFVSRANKIHKGVYDYSKVVYKGHDYKVLIGCKVHGDFEQTVNSHLAGKGCGSCTGVKVLTRDEFIARANKIHNHQYDYSKVDYINGYMRINIVCKTHGVFTQVPHTHLQSGCPKCGYVLAASKMRSTLEDFVAKATQVHEGRYDYTKAVLKSHAKKLIITCKVHGDFLCTPNNHISKKSGCASCAGVKPLSTEEFIVAAQSIHGDKYTYLKTEFVINKEKVLITCPKHGDFYQRASDHTHKKAGCPRCARSQSKAETEVFTFVQSLGFDAVQRNRKIIKPYELDIVVPEKNLAIEYNGLYFHSDAFPDARSRHKQKSDQCQAAGYKLVHIYEDDWLTRSDVVKKTLKHILGVSDEKLYARKLTVQVLPAKATKPFYADNHMQGAGRGDSWCLMDDDRIVAAMQFGISSSERGNKDNSRYELIRFATSCQVVGGASKLFKAFLKDNPDVQTIISYSDNDMFTGKMYEVLGFVNAGQTPPDYKVIIGQQRYHKANFKKSQIKKNYPDTYDEALTEKEMCHKLGFYRIYNTGLTKWIWTK